jgi:hypothetical protein
MRGAIAILLSVTLAGYASSSMADGRIRLAQSSAATTCMMGCNSQAANCQTACLIPSSQFSQSLFQNGPVTSSAINPQTSATANSNQQTNATANTMCLSACTTTQLSCQINCARLSPSR